MGGRHSDLKHKEGETNSLEDSKVTTGSNQSLAEGKEPPTFQELCARQQNLFARSDALKSAVAPNNNRRSFRSELADIVLKGPKRPVQPPEEETEVLEDVCAPGPSTPRVKLSYRRQTLDGNSTPEMKAVVNKYFDTLEELKRFVVSDEIYLDRKAPSTEDKAGDCEQDLGKEDTGAAEINDSAAKGSCRDLPSTVEESEVIDEQVDILNPSVNKESPSASVETTEHSAGIFKEESTSPQTTPEKKKKKGRKAKKTKKTFSCFSSENCE